MSHVSCQLQPPYPVKIPLTTAEPEINAGRSGKREHWFVSAHQVSALSLHRLAMAGPSRRQFARSHYRADGTRRRTKAERDRKQQWARGRSYHGRARDYHPGQGAVHNAQAQSRRRWSLRTNPRSRQEATLFRDTYTTTTSGSSGKANGGAAVGPLCRLGRGRPAQAGHGRRWNQRPPQNSRSLPAEETHAAALHYHAGGP